MDDKKRVNIFLTALLILILLLTWGGKLVMEQGETFEKTDNAENTTNETAETQVTGAAVIRYPQVP
ncbi:TPA: hypothetical protein HA265_05710 [Candidatus Woesearchaeota archaeon]|nr:hypothetical protein [Candidatus Woesearchaeota archaeon]